ncbi:MAG: hypothetical protein HY962_05955 [Ignavibacteriae bacterium]|nr:hypothetical protein [Ignavibacteriota bacterium]
MNPTSIARAASVLMVPPVPAAIVCTFYVLHYEHGGLAHLAAVWSTAVAASGGIQIAFVLWLTHRGRVGAYDVPERSQRDGPYLFSVATSLVGMIVLMVLDASMFLWGLLWCYSVNTLILAIINRFWKISAHMMGTTGPLSALVPITGPWLIVAAPFLVLLGWSRVHLGSHNVAQVVAGTLAGVILTILQLFLVFAYGPELADALLNP